MSTSPWLQLEDRAFIDAVLDALADGDEAAYHRWQPAEVLELDDVRAARLYLVADDATPEEHDT